MNKGIREKKDNLYEESVLLRNLANETPGEKGFLIRDKQNEVYKKWEFYANIIKANDKVNSEIRRDK